MIKCAQTIFLIWPPVPAMNILSLTKRTLAETPISVKRFLKKALLLFACWLLLYYLVLQPLRVPDKFLTNLTALSTAGVLNIFYEKGFTIADVEKLNSSNKQTPGTIIILNKNETLFVADACNAFDLYVLYIAFLICLPTNRSRFWSFCVVGIAGIFILNIVRCFALTWLYLNKPSYMDFAHHYVFTLIVYGCIFLGWVYYANKKQLNNVVKK